jgi:pyruvate,water dikinase
MQDLYQMISTAYHSLASRCGAASPPVAVRSSAPDEDGLTASFAGQYKTFLNIAGVDSVAKAIACCWASVGGGQLQAYRDRQGGSAPDGTIAVLVQQLVAADQSAVAFSANPITRRRDEVLINCNLGLGESIVSGSVTPDAYAVRKSDWTITTRHVGDKLSMIVPGTTGTRAVPVPRSMRTRPAMSDAQVMAVARLAESLEKTVGWPVDIECSYAGGELFLLQCRPITTISDA